MSNKKPVEGLACRPQSGVWLIAYSEGSKEKIERQCKKNRVQLQDVFHIATFSKPIHPRKDG